MGRRRKERPVVTLSDIGDLAEVIRQELEDYSAKADEIMQEEIQKLGEDIVVELKGNAIIPQRTPGEKTYKKKFYIKKIGRGLGWSRIVVANKKYELTHLLEYGHVTRNGGRTRAFPHWKQAQQTVETLPERVRKALEK